MHGGIVVCANGREGGYLGILVLELIGCRHSRLAVLDELREEKCKGTQPDLAGRRKWIVRMGMKLDREIRVLLTSVFPRGSGRSRARRIGHPPLFV